MDSKNYEEIVNNQEDMPQKSGKLAELWRSVKFVLFSMSAGIIQMGSFALLNEVIFVGNYWVSYLISLVLSVIWNFTLNRKFTFKSANNVPKAMLLVGLFYLVFTPASTWLEKVLTDLQWNEYLVTFINMFLNLVLEFLYDRFIVFKDSIDTNDIAQKQQAKAEQE